MSYKSLDDFSIDTYELISFQDITHNRLRNDYFNYISNFCGSVILTRFKCIKLEAQDKRLLETVTYEIMLVVDKLKHVNKE